MADDYAEEFWAAVDAEVAELSATEDPRAAADLAMNVAALPLELEWAEAIAFEDVFYGAWMELSDLFDGPAYAKVTDEEADRRLRAAATEWLATPTRDRRKLLDRWRRELATLATKLGKKP